MNFLLIVTFLSILTFVLVIILLVINKKEDIKSSKNWHENLILKEEIKELKYEIGLLKQKELILYLIAEMLHNEKDRDITYGAEETSIMLAKARRFTPYYGGKYVNENELERFIDYLSNDAWIKIFKKPASETDFKVKEWFERKQREQDHWVAFGKTNEGLSSPLVKKS